MAPNRILSMLPLLLAVGCNQPNKSEPVASATASASAAPPSCVAHCKMGGLCVYSAEHERCVATSDEDCAKSDSCRTSGLCVMEKTVCIGTSKKHCEQSERCKREGLCSFTKPGLYPCGARGDDCKGTELCSRKGKCSVVSGKCAVKDDSDCSDTEACKLHGQCSAKPGWQGNETVYTCAAVSDEDCAKSEDCTERGLCHAEHGGCMHDDAPRKEHGKK